MALWTISIRIETVVSQRAEQLEHVTKLEIRHKNFHFNQKKNYQEL